MPFHNESGFLPSLPISSLNFSVSSSFVVTSGRSIRLSDSDLDVPPRLRLLLFEPIVTVRVPIASDNSRASLTSEAE